MAEERLVVIVNDVFGGHTSPGCRRGGGCHRLEGFVPYVSVFYRIVVLTTDARRHLTITNHHHHRRSSTTFACSCFDRSTSKVVGGAVTDR